MNKQDWIEYFEALNGRVPSAEEMAQGLAAGEYIDETSAVQAQARPVAPVQEQVVSQPNPTAQVAYQQQTPYQQQAVAGQMPNYQTPGVPMPAQPSAFSEGVKSYFNWFLKGFTNPESKSEVSHIGFGLGTIGAASLFIGWSLINFMRRFLLGFINSSYKGDSLKDIIPDTYVKARQAVTSHYGFLQVLLFLVVFFVFYVLLMTLPVVFNRDRSKTFIQKVGQYFSYTPILFVLNVITFLISFFVPTAFVTDKLFTSLSSLSSSSGLSMSGLAKAVPALKPVETSGFIMGIFIGLGFLMLLISFIRNVSEVTFAKVNGFYVSLLSTIVFVILIFILRVIIAAVMTGGLENIYHSFIKQFVKRVWNSSRSRL